MIQIFRKMTISFCFVEWLMHQNGHNLMMVWVGLLGMLHSMQLGDNLNKIWLCHKCSMKWLDVHIISHSGILCSFIQFYAISNCRHYCCGPLYFLCRSHITWISNANMNREKTTTFVYAEETKKKGKKGRCNYFNEKCDTRTIKLRQH